MNYREQDHEFDRYVKSVVELSKFNELTPRQKKKQKRIAARTIYSYTFKHN